MKVLRTGAAHKLLQMGANWSCFYTWRKRSTLWLGCAGWSHSITSNHGLKGRWSAFNVKQPRGFFFLIWYFVIICHVRRLFLYTFVPICNNTVKSRDSCQIGPLPQRYCFTVFRHFDNWIYVSFNIFCKKILKHLA
jgi:hypothetical protein